MLASLARRCAGDGRAPARPRRRQETERELTLEQALALAQEAQPEPRRRARPAGAGADQHRAGVGAAVPDDRRAGEVHAQLQAEFDFAARCSITRPTASGARLLIQPRQSAGRRRQLQGAAVRSGRLAGPEGGQERHRRLRGELRGCPRTTCCSAWRRRSTRRPSADEVLVARALEHRRSRSATLENAQDALGGGHGHQGGRRPRRAGGGARRAASARRARASEQAYRALATLIQADGPFRVDAAGSRCRRRTPSSDLTWRSSCGPSSGPSS